MKKFGLLSFALSLFLTLFSFSTKRGGDIVEIYFNGKQVLRQFIHIDNSVKSLSLPDVNGGDKVDVFYSHCGHVGTARVITIRNEKNQVLKTLSFADSRDNRSAMHFSMDAFAGGKQEKLSLYYSSKELPEGRLLATVVCNDGRAVAKH